MRWLFLWWRFASPFLLCAFAADACAKKVPLERARFYEYVLYLPGSAVQASAAEALRGELAGNGLALARHRMTTADALRHWDGNGPIPIAVEARVLPDSSIDGVREAESGDAVRELLHLPAGRGARALAVMVGVPPPRDVVAYAEALRFTVEAAKRVKAPVAYDGEFSEVVRVEELGERLQDALPDRRRPGSSTMPRLGVMGSLTSIAQLPDGGLRLRGLRRIGLPDIVIERWTPRFSGIELMLSIAQLLVSGAVPPTRCSSFTLHADDEAFLAGYGLRGRPGGAATMGFACDHDHGQSGTDATDVLRVTFPTQGTGSGYERQAAVLESLLPSRFKGWDPGSAMAMELAIARALERLENSQARLRQDAGMRLIVASGIDKAAAKAGTPVYWYEILKLRDDGVMDARSLTGDPRFGGVALQYDPPPVLNGKSIRFAEAELHASDVDDVVIIDAKGHATGGEVVDLLMRHGARALE